MLFLYSIFFLFLYTILCAVFFALLSIPFFYSIFLFSFCIPLLRYFFCMLFLYAILYTILGCSGAVLLKHISEGFSRPANNVFI